MSEKRTCPACTGEMKLLSKSYKIGKNGKYRIRKFRCTVCDEEESVYADGKRDDDWEPEITKQIINDNFKKEERARQTDKTK